MVTKVQEWGNSQGLRLSKQLLDDAQIAGGDLIVLTFDPQSDHEQKGRRRALVISHHLFNKHTGFAIVCPITTTRNQSRKGHE